MREDEAVLWARKNETLDDKWHTDNLGRMTMFSFRVDDEAAEETRRWADRLGMDRSELLRDALHRYFVRLRAESDDSTMSAPSC